MISASTYAFSRSGFSNTTLTSPVELIGANSDNVASAVTDIGFTFWFAGTQYTQFSVSENGLLKLGSTQISGSDVSNNMASATTLPKLAPYWDDLATGTNGYVKYSVNGTAPNRILIVEWFVTIPKNAGGAANTAIQCHLYETSGNINFNTGWPGPGANANGYTIGIGVAANDFASVTITGTTTATASYTTSATNTLAYNGYSRFSFTTDKAAPTISAGTIPNTGGTANRVISKTIADPRTGVPITGSLIPRIYFKKSTDASYVSTAGVLTAGTSASGTWEFTVDHSLIPGGVAEGDLINYFFIAQDQSTTTGVPNISSFPAGVVATDVNTVTTPPTPSTYILGPSLSGTKTVGTGGDYSSLTLSGGLFELINAGSLTGSLTINIISDLTETGAIPLNAWVNGPGGPFTITINPVGVRTLNLAPYGLRFNGAKGVTLDGLNNGSNSLEILGGLQFYYGASNNTFTRLKLTGAGITSTDASGTFPVNCSNNIISDNIIEGMLYFGSWVSTTGLNNVIDNNIIRNFSQYGIHIDRGYRNFTISNNDIYQIAAGNYSTGIYINNEAGNTNIFNNRIHDIRSGTGLGVWTAALYYRFGLTTDVLNIYNNVIYLDATTTNTASYQLYAFQMEGSGTSNIYHNSVYIGGTGVTTGNTAGLYKTNGTVNFKNNSVYIPRAFAAVNPNYKIYGISVSNLTNLISDNNLIFLDGLNSVFAKVGATTYASLTEWQTATSLDAASVSANPGYTSPTDLTPDIANPGSANLDNHGAPIASVTTDILGTARSTTTPDIGAYEFGIPVKTLNLKLFLEGLYNGSGAMNQAADATGPHWPAGIADHITVELHDAANYATIVHTVNDASLSTDGTLTLTLPVSLNASYYVTARHRNSIETTTPTSKSFAGSVINHDFTTGVAQAFGENLKLIGGTSVIFTGDVNQDGSVDTGDMIPVDNDSFNYASGYLSSDVNGDGSIDTADMIFIDNNSAAYVGTMHP